MLRIRQEQLVQMEEAGEQEYHDQLMRFYRRNTPQLVSHFDDVELRQRVADATRKARRWGVRTGEGILQFVGLALAAGPAFDEEPKVRHFLTLPDSPPDHKVRRLVELVVEDLEEPVQ